MFSASDSVSEAMHAVMKTGYHRLTSPPLTTLLNNHRFDCSLMGLYQSSCILTFITKTGHLNLELSLVVTLSTEFVNA